MDDAWTSAITIYFVLLHQQKYRIAIFGAGDADYISKKMFAEWISKSEDISPEIRLIRDKIVSGFKSCVINDDGSDNELMLELMKQANQSILR